MRKRTTRPANTKKIIGSEDAIFLLNKLGWEIRAIHEHPHDGITERIYRSINCALTAWHLTDWLWMLSSEEQRKSLCEITEVQKYDTKEFHVAIQKWCPAIALCRQIATAAKHLDIDYDREDVWLEGMFDDEETEHATTLYITDGSSKQLDVDVYIEAFNAWTALYIRVGMPKSQEIARLVSRALHGELPKVQQVQISDESTEESK